MSHLARLRRYKNLTTKMIVVSVLRILCSLVAIFGVITELGIHVAHGDNTANFFSYFSYQANLLALLFLMANGIQTFFKARPSRLFEAFRGCSFVAMLLVGLVFNILLRSADAGGLESLANNIVHVVMPLVVCIDYIVMPPHEKFGLKIVFGWLVFPLGYLVYSLVRDPIVNWYPYYFLNPSKVGTLGVVMYSLAILLLFFGLAFIAKAIAGHSANAAIQSS